MKVNRSFCKIYTHFSNNKSKSVYSHALTANLKIQVSLATKYELVSSKNNIIYIKLTRNTEMCLNIHPISSCPSFVHVQVKMQTHEKLSLNSHATMDQFMHPRLRADLEPWAFFRVPQKRDPLKMVLFSEDNEKQSNTSTTDIHMQPQLALLSSSSVLHQHIRRCVKINKCNKGLIDTDNSIHYHYHHYIRIVKSARSLLSKRNGFLL